MTCSTSPLYPAYVVFLTGSVHCLFLEAVFWFLLPCTGFWSLKYGKLSSSSPSTSSSATTEWGTYLNFCFSSRTALRPCGWKTSCASMFTSEWPRPICCFTVPATSARQQCIGILPPVLVDHPDGCKPAEEVSAKCDPGISDALVRSVCLGCILEQREHWETACMLLLYDCIFHIFLFLQGPGGSVQLSAAIKRVSIRIPLDISTSLIYRLLWLSLGIGKYNIQVCQAPHC